MMKWAIEFGTTDYITQLSNRKHCQPARKRVRYHDYITQLSNILNHLYPFSQFGTTIILHNSQTLA